MDPKNLNNFKQKIKLDSLKSQFVHILIKYCIPITKRTVRKEDLAWLAHQTINKDLLELLPVYDKQKKIKLLELDPLGKPIGLTTNGHLLMLKLLLHSP